MIVHILNIPLVFRSGIAFLLCLLLFLILGKKVARWLGGKGIVDYFRLDSPSTHESKKGTPSGAGLFILLCLGLSFFLLGDIFNRYTYIPLFATFCMGFSGLADDMIKKMRGSSRGLSIKVKLLLQLGVLVPVALFTYHLITEISTQIRVPFTHFQIELGIFYFPVVVFIILGSSNAVNLTDGLDGLAAGCMIAPAAIFIVISVIRGDMNLSSFFNRTYLPGVGELAFFWCALLGALLGFLRYNRYPAELFMGGVGSEALGGALGISAILLKEELLLLLIGGVFVVEALSVILQVIFYRLEGRRVFKMTPLHHHFELRGLKESRIVTGFWTASVLLCSAAFLSIALF